MRNIGRFGMLFAILLIAAGPPADPSGALRSVLSDYDSYLKQIDPVSAGQRGDLAAASRWPDDTQAAVARHQDVLAGLQQRLRAIPQTSLHGEDLLNCQLLTWRIDLDMDGERFDEERIPFTSDEGFFVLPSYTADSTSPHDIPEAEAWLSRLRALPAYLDAEIANMRRGLAQGFTQPRLTAMAAAKTARAMADTAPEQDPLLSPLSRLPSSVPVADRDRLSAEALDIVRTKVKPAQRSLAGFFSSDYVPHARQSLGASQLPGGRDYYAYRVRHETTTGLSPDEIFALGTTEIARIRAAMALEIKAAGFTGSFQQFQAFLRKDKQFYASSREDLLDKASRLAKLVDDKLPAFFGKLPRLTYGVRPVPAILEEGYTTGRYNPGSPEEGVAGGLMINTSHLDQRPLYELPALVAHEGVPGHHIQIALAQEQGNVPDFRKDYDITAFVEGWALYSEQLGREIGIYRTPYERFGLLSMEMWRACRLVIDVGLHWKGWTREQAVACLRDNTGLADKNIQNEVDRYIAWPGQALGYKVGELKIMELRRQAQAELGPAFDWRRFHDAVLDEGAMPLDMLEKRIVAWIAAEKTATSQEKPRAG